MAAQESESESESESDSDTGTDSDTSNLDAYGDELDSNYDSDSRSVSMNDDEDDDEEETVDDDDERRDQVSNAKDVDMGTGVDDDILEDIDASQHTIQDHHDHVSHKSAKSLPPGPASSASTSSSSSSSSSYALSSSNQRSLLQARFKPKLDLPPCRHAIDWFTPSTSISMSSSNVDDTTDRQPQQPSPPHKYYKGATFCFLSLIDRKGVDQLPSLSERKKRSLTKDDLCCVLQFTPTEFDKLTFPWESQLHKGSHRGCHIKM